MAAEVLFNTVKSKKPVSNNYQMYAVVIEEDFILTPMSHKLFFSNNFPEKYIFS